MMDTPIFDFVRKYNKDDNSRLHMPGHKGIDILGCESMDITEITGADSLYEANGIISRSEKNASKLFSTAATFYSTEGSSQCIRAMLYLAMLSSDCTDKRPVIVAARNAHKTFVLSSALLDFDIEWLWDESDKFSLCSCYISAEQLENKLKSLSRPPVAVYVTSPDYLGNTLDIESLAKVAHKFSVPLIVDNAHGAYLNFFDKSQHPIALGADICCDSAHKTLPVLTGGAYLQISKSAPVEFIKNARRALALFGSTSPSYLILQSLDLANGYIADGYSNKLLDCIERINKLKLSLCKYGWKILKSDELKLTINSSQCGYHGNELAEILENGGVICEYSDPDYLVLMFTPQNHIKDYDKVENILLNTVLREPANTVKLTLNPPKRICSVRKAMFSQCETVPVESSTGRILAASTVGCPPAIPVVVSGELIESDAVKIFKYYGIDTVDVII